MRREDAIPAGQLQDSSKDAGLAEETGWTIRIKR